MNADLEIDEKEGMLQSQSLDVCTRVFLVGAAPRDWGVK